VQDDTRGLRHPPRRERGGLLSWRPFRTFKVAATRNWYGSSSLLLNLFRDAECAPRDPDVDLIVQTQEREATPRQQQSQYFPACGPPKMGRFRHFGVKIKRLFVSRNSADPCRFDEQVSR